MSHDSTEPDFRRKAIVPSDEISNQDLDEEIRQTQAHLQAIASLRNKRNIACRLPAEVLEMILLKTIHMHLDREDYEFKAPSWREHVQLTGVCKNWRAVALECGAFWTCIPVKTSAHYKDMLRRTRKSPIRVRAQVSSSSAGELLAALVKVVPSASVLECHIEDAYGGFLFGLAGSSFLDHPTPILSSLRLAGSNDLQVPGKLWTQPRPKLRHLTLSECEIPWNSLTSMPEPHPLPQLVTLKIKYSDPVPSFQEFTKLITACPALETLVLVLSAPSVDAETSQNTAIQPVACNSLTNCRIHDDLIRCEGLFSTVLRVPPTSSVAIRVADFAWEDCERSLAALIKHSPNPNVWKQSAFVSLQFKSTDFCIDLRHSTRSGTVGGDPSSSKHLDGELGKASLLLEVPPEMTRYLLGALDFPTIVDLVVDDQSTPSYIASFPEEWTSFLGKHPKITQVASEDLTQLLVALTPCANRVPTSSTSHGPEDPSEPEAQASSAPEEESVLLPKLARICVLRTTLGLLGLEEKPSPQEIASTEQLALLERLRDFLVNRKKLGYPIQEVYITRHTIGYVQEAHAMLSETGTRVFW